MTKPQPEPTIVETYANGYTIRRSADGTYNAYDDSASLVEGTSADGIHHSCRLLMRIRRQQREQGGAR